MSEWSRSVMSNSLWPQGLQHARLSCPWLSSRVCSDSCPLSRWSHPTISFSVVPFSCLQSFPASGSFPTSLALCFRCPKYWSFSISPENILIVKDPNSQNRSTITVFVNFFPINEVSILLKILTILINIKISLNATTQVTSINSLVLSIIFFSWQKQINRGNMHTSDVIK